LFAKEELEFTPDKEQEKALRCRAKRLILNCHRQWGKDQVAAILALHKAIYDPPALVLITSPSLRQSSELFRRINDLSKPMKGQPDRTEDNKLSLTYSNGSRIISLCSKEQTVRGYAGAKLIIENEAARVADELYMAVRPMLAVSNGSLILMSTPFGMRGHFFETWMKGGPDWERIKVTADECPRISKQFLKEEYEVLGEWWYLQEYMCEFQDTVDQVFKYEQIDNALDDEVEALFEDIAV
jgi:hypothetical protein